MSALIISLISFFDGVPRNEVAKVEYFKVGHCYRLVHLFTAEDKSPPFVEIKCK